MNENIKNILVVSVAPYFLEKENNWFQENLEQILSARKTQLFFQENTEFLKIRENYNFSELLRKLDEMGYEKVFKISDPGEFSQRGGVLDIFPVNLNCAVRLDFFGNKLESIKPLEEIKISDEKKSREFLKKKLKNQKLFSDLKNIKTGDWLVHLDHGVGKFVGIEKIKDHEYYILEYAQGDKLFVPAGLERKLSRYVGFSDPLVSRLGSSLWQRTKRKIKEEVEKLAKELLDLYAKKEIVKRAPYFDDKEMEEQLKISFLYEETPDQIQALEDIKKDLKQEKPMDRIVCGDVGFGKTEIAMRSALMTVANGKQVAIMSPTTILALQHFENFKKRFKNLPIKIALLSRLQSQSEEKKYIKEIKEGKVDIIIGTHRVLSKDVEFKNLQMLIIDDEQKFGVKQKEKLRKTNPSLDILSLSATPIPRTIYLALASFKNISLIQTPPQGRLAIKTKVLPYNKKIVEMAIKHELERNGQVYFLHNRVESIEKVKKNLQKLAPFAKIGFIHGRMPQGQLLKTMHDFENGKTNVLVSTTIIENGIDLSNVNTIIIEDATRLGLSQAYQIRGRVGRGQKQGFAYLFYPPKSLTHLAKERLKALKEANELGAGYRIAIKDLELRGAGNVLGKEQSGAINRVGLNLYSQMLSEAVEKLRQ